MKKNSQLKQILPLTQATKDNLPQVKSELKSQLPVLTFTGVRRYRVRHDEAAVLELEENCMTDAAEFLSHLLNLGKNYKIEKDEEEILLNNQDSLIDQLKNKLIAAEIAKRNNNAHEQISILYNLASFFRLLSSRNWSWIVDEILNKSLKVSATLNDSGQMKNIIKFIYAKFLLEDKENYSEALEYLEQVKNASEKKNWNATNFLKIKQDSLFAESCILMSKIFIILSQNTRDFDPGKSVAASENALKHGIMSGYDNYIAEALYQMGKSQIAAKNMKEALKNFTKYLANVKKNFNYEGICNAYRELAFVLQHMKDTDGALKYLHQFKSCANEFKLSLKMIEADYCIGEYYLHQNRANDAISHLATSFNQYKSLGMTAEMNKSRFQLGIARGEAVMEEYMQLILKCEKKDGNAMKKLLDWKNDRIPFWMN